MGRRPTPTALKLARGTVRARDAVPLQPVGAALPVVPDAPDSLQAVGKQKWAEWGARLAEMKLLETRFLDALEMYCRAWDKLTHYEAVLDKQGEFTTTEKGFICRHPAAVGARQARDEIRRYQIEFGLTPSSASSVKVSPKTPATDKRKRFFGGPA